MNEPRITADDTRQALLSLSGEQITLILMEMNKPTIVADILDHYDSDFDKLLDLIKRIGLDTELSQKLLQFRKAAVGHNMKFPDRG